MKLNIPLGTADRIFQIFTGIIAQESVSDRAIPERIDFF